MWNMGERGGVGERCRVCASPGRRAAHTTGGGPPTQAPHSNGKSDRSDRSGRSSSSGRSGRSGRSEKQKRQARPYLVQKPHGHVEPGGVQGAAEHLFGELLHQVELVRLRVGGGGVRGGGLGGGVCGWWWCVCVGVGGGLVRVTLIEHGSSTASQKSTNE